MSVLTQAINKSSIDIAKKLFRDEVNALLSLESRLDNNFEQAITLIETCRGRVIVTGMGKSGLIGKKIAATLSSTGTPSYFLHPGEGIHGDLGLLMTDDVLLAISNSGETPELLQILPVIKYFKLPLIAITGNQNSTLSKNAHVTLDVSVQVEGCPLNLAPMASTTTTLVLGDAIAVSLMNKKGFSASDFALFHPAGILGKRLLLTVEDIMHTGASVPIVNIHSDFKTALLEISTKKLGMTLVLGEDGCTCGLITDGDIRRILEHRSDISTILIAEVYQNKPKTIEKTALLADALSFMRDNQISALIINDKIGRPEGVLHIHDIIKTGI